MQTQEQILNELRDAAIKLGRSPKRRDIPSLAVKCYRRFGSFNRAKTEAGLDIFNIQIEKFPANAFHIDHDLAQIASYITFDGHLYETLKGFMYSSKNIKDLEIFEKLIVRKFGLPSRYYLFSGGGGSNKTHKVCFFNKRVCEYLFELGVPKGDKVIQKFVVPAWIMDSKEFSREYLKIAYLCEGSLKDDQRKNPRITINTAKEIEIIDSGLNFMNSLRRMLRYFEIETLEPYLTPHRLRKKDGKLTRDIRFRIRTKDNDKFISEIGWLK